jgi:hypothetical protein
MAVPDWVSYATLGVSAVSAMGAGTAAVITTRSHRRQSQREWERDHVTERYTELRRALMALIAAHVESVEPLFGQHPMPKLDGGWEALRRAYGVLLDRRDDASVVSRRRVGRVIPYVAAIDYNVMAPFSRPVGIPPIAGERLHVELGHAADLSAVLLGAMRTDLGLTNRRKTKSVDTAIRRFIERAKQSRSTFAADNSLDKTIKSLRAYQVGALAGADGNYRIKADHFAQYCAQLPPLLAGKGSEEAMLIWSGDTLQAGVRTDLPTERITQRLRQIGVVVESGFRNDAGSDGWRPMPDESRAFRWTSASPIEVDDFQSHQRANNYRPRRRCPSFLGRAARRRCDEDD